jgi:hypothetical protein
MLAMKDQWDDLAIVMTGNAKQVGKQRQEMMIIKNYQ